ncbi:MAG TPA: RHS repeat-associated core domain-containing protein [Candidatus Acidoferrum sp.]|nr:RHS repeat-associated core domain-containing protein [Candidatus Acidoferrum sp.]
MVRYARIFCLLIVILLASSGLNAQVTTGTPPHGSFGGGPDVIDLANLNAHISIPVVHKAGRGTSFIYDLGYDSSVWYPLTSGSTKTWQPVYNWGWLSQTNSTSGSVTYKTTTNHNPPCQSPGTAYQFSQFVYFDQFGGYHPFNAFAVHEVACGTVSQFTPIQNAVATDGSGYVLNWPSNTLGVGKVFPGTITITSSSGKVFQPPVNTGGGTASVVDRNGNEITVDSSGHFYDTLSSTTPILTVSGAAPSNTTFTYVAPSGANASYTMKYGSYTVQTAFGCSGISEYGPTSNYLVNEIDLPDGSKYTFTYEQTPGVPANVTGRLASVTLPTSGTISYTYTGLNNGIMCSDGSTAGFKRYTPDTGTSYWNYSRTQETGAASIAIVTDPTAQANQSIIQFQGIYETQRDIYSGSAPSFSSFPIPESTLQTSNLQKEIQTCYNANTSNCTSTSITLPITQRNSTRLLSGASSWTSAQTAETIYKYNSTGGLIEQDDYDYGAGGVGALLKKTSITYASLIGITSFPKQVTITNGSGTTVSQTNNNYGDTVTATSGTPQHTTPPGSRGNLLSVNYYTQGSTFLTKSFTYYDTGTINQAADVNGAQTTYTYGSGSCGNSFPTSISEPLSLSRTMTYNCTGAVQSSVVDENGQTSSTAYTTDPFFWRPNSVTDQSGAQTTFTYTGQTQVESDLPIVSGTSASDAISVRDSFGRPSLSQIRQIPGGTTFDTAETDYDAVGRPYRSTLPFAASLGQTNSTAPGATTTYDALGRVTGTTDSGTGAVTNAFSQNDVLVTRGPAPTGEHTKQHQSEYDALGRLSSVCEVTSMTGSGTCAQTNSKTGFWTKYTYDALGHLTGVTQNAQSSSTQSRSFAYDLRGRMISESEAESGTTTYTYDTDSSCGTSNGDLVKRVDAVGNVTCYAYDSLHRMTSVTYPSGSYSSKTPNKYFVYDSATVNSVAMANGKTRMVEAYTATTQNGTKITDVGLSYTVRGEPSDVYEKTPNSGGYYHVAEQYWAHGAAKQLSGLSSLPTFTYSLDGEGRVKQVSASSGQNPVTSIVFNNASLPTSVTFGSGDTDSFSYDSNTDRMTQYQFTINGQSLTGVLTWNANSTLQNLNITDAFNSTDTQSCAYLYDDLVRIQSANCGSIWSQTFSYDPFGNISKSGTASFAAVYSASTNRITSVGSFTPTYDANGNTLTDPAHTYSWDSAGKPVTIDTVNMTYDALGRMVEQNRSGVFTQFVYGPHGGKFAIMNAQTLQKAIVPLVGGAQAVYNANGLLYYGHSDHLGSIRLGSTSARGVSFDLAYAPFGETYAPYPTSGSTDPAFTGQRQDTVTGLFDFPDREYSNEGRWSSPDPSGIAAFHLTDPQSLNRYVYARNTPTSLVDPTGLCYGPNTPGGEIDNCDLPQPTVGSGEGTSGEGVCYTAASCPSGAILGQQQGECDPTYCTQVSASLSDGTQPTVETQNAALSDSLQDCGCLLGQFTQQDFATLGSASDWVTAGTIYTAAAWGSIVSVGVLAEAPASAPLSAAEKTGVCLVAGVGAASLATGLEGAIGDRLGIDPSLENQAMKASFASGVASAAYACTAE